MPNRDRWLLLGWCLLLAFLVRWPTSLFWDALPQDPNTPLHALAAFDLASGQASTTQLTLLGYPDGLGVRLLAWPVLLCSIPFQWILDPIPAFNLGILLWVTIQGMAVIVLGTRLGWNLSAKMLSSAALVTAPTTLRALGNGQYENLTGFAFVVGMVALLSKGRHAALWGFLAGILAAFSSPYQGVVVGALIGIGVLMTKAKESWPALAGVSAALASAVLYFRGVTNGDVHLSAVPAPGAMAESASLGEVLNPFFYAPPHSTGSLPAAGLSGAQESLSSMTQIPSMMEFGANWPWVNSVAYGYAGAGLILMGGWGLWKHRSEIMCRILGVFGLACLAMALGRTLIVAPGIETAIPMPWAIPSQIASVGQMQATVRFLTGLAFAAAIGLGYLAQSISWRTILPVGLLVVVDGLIISPNHWPVPATEPHLNSVMAQMDDGPVASWPGPPNLAPRNHQTLVLILQRPVAWFSGDTPENQELLEQGDNPRIQDLEQNEHGESPHEWLRRTRASGVSTIIEFKTDDSRNLNALGTLKAAPVCGLEICATSLTEAEHPPSRLSQPAEPLH